MRTTIIAYKDSTFLFSKYMSCDVIINKETINPDRVFGFKIISDDLNEFKIFNDLNGWRLRLHKATKTLYYDNIISGDILFERHISKERTIKLKKLDKK